MIKYKKRRYEELFDMDTKSLDKVLEVNKAAYNAKLAAKHALITQILWLQEQVEKIND